MMRISLSLILTGDVPNRIYFGYFWRALGRARATWVLRVLLAGLLPSFYKRLSIGLVIYNCLFSRMQGQESYSSRQKLSQEGSLGTGIVLQAMLCQLQECVEAWDGKISPALAQIHTQLETMLRTASPKDLEPLVAIVIKLIKRGSPTKFLCEETILKRLSSYYNGLCNSLERISISTRHEQQPQLLEFRMLATLSLISQIINENPCTKFPFTKRFSQNIFMMSFQLVRVSAGRREILRILSVLLLALSKQSKALKQFELAPRIRASLLQNYHLIEDYRTLERFSKALKSVVGPTPLTLAEIKKYRIIETVNRFNSQKPRQPTECREEKKHSEPIQKCVIFMPQPIRAQIN